MQLKSFQCPDCGADIRMKKGDKTASCEYCGKYFVAIQPESDPTPQDRLERINDEIQALRMEQVETRKSNRSKTSTSFIVFFVMVALFIMGTTLFMVISSFLMQKNANNIAVQYGDSSTYDEEYEYYENMESEPVYKFRTEEIRDLCFEKQGKAIGYLTPLGYEIGAANVVRDPDALSKMASDGCMVYYRPDSNEFVKLSEDGYIRLYICPVEGMDYYNEQ